MIEQEGLAERVGWSMHLFLDENRAKISKWNVPQDVATTVAMKRSRGKMLLGMVGGGVVVSPYRTVRDLQLVQDDEFLPETQRTARNEELPKGHWWWD